MDRGYLRVGTFAGVALRLHLFAIVALFLLGFFSSRPWLGVATFAILVFHELGHAFLARRCGFHVAGIDLSVFQGACHYRGNITPRAEAVVAWGGVLAQLVLLGFSFGANHVFHPSEASILGDTTTAWFIPNLVILCVNLLPVRGLDGAKAWSVFEPARVKAIARSKVLEARAANLERELATIEDERKRREKYDVN